MSQECHYSTIEHDQVASHIAVNILMGLSDTLICYSSRPASIFPPLDIVAFQADTTE